MCGNCVKEDGLRCFVSGLKQIFLHRFVTILYPQMTQNAMDHHQILPANGILRLEDQSTTSLSERIQIESVGIGDERKWVQNSKLETTFPEINSSIQSYIEMDVISNCGICGKSATKLCSACKKVAYCSVEHQRKDWKVHKSSCRIYLVKKNDIMGRYVVASKDILPGTVIMDEAALMIGPKQDSLPICLGCHKRLTSGSYQCSKCGLPMCSVDCEKLQIHSENECSVFCKGKPFNLKLHDFNTHHPIYQCILTLRCLLLKDKDPTRWDKLNMFEHHNDLRQKMSTLWNRNEVNTVNFLRNVYKLDFDPMTIHSVVGYADINAFEIRSHGVEICGLFPEVQLMAHDCISNTHHSITDDNRMVVRNTVPIKKGDMITTTYTHTLEGTLERREHILDAKLFACCCARCSSPTELGTNFSSVKCLSCGPGYLVPKDPLNPESIWECEQCHTPRGAEAIRATVKGIRDEIEAAEKGHGSNPIPILEEIFERHSGVMLHPQHCLMVAVLHSLSQFYGRTTNFIMTDLTLEQLQRKEQVCLQLLKVLDVIEPGMSRIRGLTLYELQAAIFLMAQQKFKSGQMDKDKLKEKLETVIELLKTSMQILQFDSPSSTTGKIATTIPQSLEGVRQILHHFCGSAGSPNEIQ